jgi:mono/diheme cytochrome c family protein
MINPTSSHALDRSPAGEIRVAISPSLVKSCLASLVLLMFGLINGNLHAQAPTPKQKQAVKQLKTSIDRAGKQFTAKKFEASSQYIQQAMSLIDGLAVDASPELIELIKPEYERLEKAHKLLSENGQKLDELKPLPAPMSGDGEAVSFKNAVAPILVAKCGNCHVNRNRGDFSAATFDALDKSTMVSYGLPDTSRMIEVIVSGEMPKGGLKVEPEELQTLKTWIKQGAKFDGDNRNQSLNEFVTTPAPPPVDRAQMEPKLPTGKETVSFGLHVAPIILENCAQCHINNNPRGNFNMADFRGLLAGGDGGNPIQPGNSANSPLIKRLRGDGAEVMPPTGKLDDKLIDIVAKWIDEGAAFDGGNARLAMQTVAAKVKADSQTHEELTADRVKLAAQTWKLVMDTVESNTIPSQNFLVTGSTNESRLTDVSKLSEKLAPKIASALRADTKKPLVKGNISIFVFDKRYDFSEFGKMVEQRDFPKEVNAHWGFNTIDAYATVLMTRNQSAEDVQVPLARQIAAIHVANLAPDMPRWFADGVGLWTAKKVFSRDEEMKALDATAEAIAAGMNKPDDFVQNRMPSDQAALVGYLFIKQLRAQSASYGKLMSGLAAGDSFEKSFEAAYGGSPSQLLGQNAPPASR